MAAHVVLIHAVEVRILTGQQAESLPKERNRKNTMTLGKTKSLGVGKLVFRLLWEQEIVGSSPTT